MFARSIIRRLIGQATVMTTAYETVICKGCGARITIRELAWSGDRTAYWRNPNFNADVPCEDCGETYSYGPDNIEPVER